MKPLTASVIGAGMGGFLSVNGLQASARYRLLGVTDVRPAALERVRAELPEVAVFSDHESMLAACPTDVVCVSTYAPSHEAITRAALQRGVKGMLVEKPLAATVTEARRLLSALREHQVPVAVPHNLVAKRTPLEVIERVRRGDIGELELMEVECSGWDLLNAGIHWLHFFVTLTDGDPVIAVTAQCDTSKPTYRDGIKVETFAVTLVETASAVRCMMLTGNHVPIRRGGKTTLFRLIGTTGLIEFYGWEQPYRIVSPAHPHGATLEPEELPVTGHQRHLELLADCIAAGRADVSAAERSLAALEIAEAAIVSARRGERVSLPLSTRATAEDWRIGEPYHGETAALDGRNL